MNLTVQVQFFQLGVTNGAMVATAEPMERSNDRFVADTVQIIEQYRMLFTKDLADDVAVTDTIVFVLSPVFVDDVTMVETFTKQVSFDRQFSESLTFTDSYAATFGKLFTDDVVVSDQASVGGGQNVNEVVSPTDVMTIVATMPQADTVTVVDSGLVTMQDYVDPTYFAEDYVGEGRTF